MNNRREFIKKSFILGSILLSDTSLFADYNEDEKITILHTNDTHSRIEPFPDDGKKNSGLGGYARRAGLIKKIKSEEKNVLIFDSGDIFQGTPYFNFFHGVLEYSLMSEMGYNAAAIGNHEFDNGVEVLSKSIQSAKFPIINSNYDFSNTPLKDKVQKNKIFEFNKIKIGVFGLGVELDGLVLKKMYGDTVYLNPFTIAKQQINYLKERNCHLIICLSHLGYKNEGKKIDDVKLARKTEGIDIILGGHSHVYLEKPTEIISSSGYKTMICQVGSSGIYLGRIDVSFTKKMFQKSFHTSLLNSKHL